MWKSLSRLAPALIVILAACEQQPTEIAATQSFAVAATEGAVFAKIRAATARYHRVEAAIADGYFRHTPCIYNTPGGRGYIYANPGLTDGVLDAARPEVLMYEPTKNGGLDLVGVAFVVAPQAWDAAHSALPSLAGQTFNAPVPPAQPNYLLTVWVWRHNPDDMFAFYNPAVSCAFADVSVIR